MAPKVSPLYVSTPRNFFNYVVVWASTDVEDSPSFLLPKHKEMVQYCWDFWQKVDNYVKSNGPFRLLKLFKHPVQSFHLQIIEKVDGATQLRAALQSSTSHLFWLQRIDSLVLRRICVSAIFAWKILDTRNLL